jgi:hypothetical protein
MVKMAYVFPNVISLTNASLAPVGDQVGFSQSSSPFTTAVLPEPSAFMMTMSQPALGLT